MPLWIPIRTSCYARLHVLSNAILETGFSITSRRNSALKKNFQNGIILLTRTVRHFYNASRNWRWVADEVEDA